jgi:pimeloyl-ACP methyl ester carboxylesterase
MKHPRRALTAALAALIPLTAIACTDGDDTGAPPMPTTATHAQTIAANGTTLHVERRGHGAPLLLVHGGGEDADMLTAQAQSLADAGYEVATYDRRGTGRSGRDDWPGGGADQHADDAIALIDALGWTDVTVVGVSSGGVIALDILGRDAADIGRVVAWEPPALGVVPGGAELNAQLLAPVDAHLAEHPDDYIGAQAVLLSFVLGVPVSPDDPAFAATRRNAETFVRDEPAIPVSPLDTGALTGADVTLAVGAAPNEAIAAAVAVLERSIDRPTVHVDADHEVYLFDPSVLTGIVTGTPAERVPGPDTAAGEAAAQSAATP